MCLPSPSYVSNSSRISSASFLPFSPLRISFPVTKTLRSLSRYFPLVITRERVCSTLHLASILLIASFLLLYFRITMKSLPSPQASSILLTYSFSNVFPSSGFFIFLRSSWIVCWPIPPLPMLASPHRSVYSVASLVFPLPSCSIL